MTTTSNGSKRPANHGHRTLILLVAVLLVGVAAAAVYWLRTSPEITTDDAQIDGHIHPINARIGGTVVWVNPAVEDTRYVEAGTVLARLDPNDYAPAVERLEGDVLDQRAVLETARYSLPVAEATATSKLDEAKAAVAQADAELATNIAAEKSAEAVVRQAKATFERAEADRKRYEALITAHEISRSEYDLRATEAITARHQFEAAEASLGASRARIEAVKQQLAQKKSQVNIASTAPEQIAIAKSHIESAAGSLIRSQAALRDAKLNLGYTTIIAPISGVVGRRSLERGQRVQAGQLILTMAPLDDVWVIAHYKETQLGRIRIGQKVKVLVDTYNREYDGIVETIGGATGARYSLLPAENATGNYVKVVQRIPVRIQMLNWKDQARPLLPGMSVVATVDAASKSAR